jgi:hypothetical protein
MPMPTRRHGESRKKFLDRCMFSGDMISNFKDTRQRYAICEKQAGPGDRGAKKTGRKS